MTDELIIAVGLLTSSTWNAWNATFTRLWPIDQSTDFTDLLRAIDEADERIRGSIDEWPPTGLPERVGLGTAIDYGPMSMAEPAGRTPPRPALPIGWGRHHGL